MSLNIQVSSFLLTKLDGFREWKVLSFLDTHKDLDRSMITNILAIGDSQFEIDAASVLASRFERACIKTIKLKTMPSIIELTKQVELINTSFEEICNSGNNLTIRL